MAFERLRRVRRTYFTVTAIPFWGVHVAAVIGVISLGWSWTGFALAIALYYARMFLVTGAYHRYFSHRTYKTSRWFQFLLALGAETSAQKGVLWWGAHHRRHHRYSDTPDDVHSPMQHGFWYAHMGWILSHDHEETFSDEIKDMAKYPELRLLNRWFLVPPTLLGVALFFIGGAHALTWGLFVSTVLLWHGTFTINSMSHVWGRRTYATDDDSRNNVVLALVTMGEGWHNNHHHYMNSVNQGFRWYQIDMTYYILRCLAAVGLIWDLKKAPRHIIEDRPRRQQKPAQAAQAGTPTSPDRAAA